MSALFEYEFYVQRINVLIVLNKLRLINGNIFDISLVFRMFALSEAK